MSFKIGDLARPEPEYLRRYGRDAVLKIEGFSTPGSVLARVVFGTAPKAWYISQHWHESNLVPLTPFETLLLRTLNDALR